MHQAATSFFQSIRPVNLLLMGVLAWLTAFDAQAVPTFTSSSSFISNSQSPAKTYMDQAGTWDNDTNSEATDDGDEFFFSFTNSVDTAFDFDLTLDVPPGFLLPSNVTTVLLDATAGACTDITVGVSQAAAGDDINFNVLPNRDILPGCTYEVTIGLTTSPSAPFATPCVPDPFDTTCDVVLNVDYNINDNDNGSRTTYGITHEATVGSSNMSLVKTTTTPVASNGQTVDFEIVMVNTGSGGLFDVELTDTLTTNLVGLTFGAITVVDNTSGLPVTAPFTVGSPAANQITFDYIPQNARVTIQLQATASVNPLDTNCPNMTNLAEATNRTPSTASNFITIDFNLANSLSLTHDVTPITGSYCELCGRGTIRLLLSNLGGISLVNINLREDLKASGLTYVNGSTEIDLRDGSGFNPAANPVVSGADNEILDWTPALITALDQLDSPFAASPPNPDQIEFRFQVETAPGFNDEDLVTAVRNIQPSATYELICGGIGQSTTGAEIELPIRQPIPVTTKLGRNIDAGQGAGSYANIVYGHIEDSVIWRVEVQNNNATAGPADMQDLLVNETIGGSFDINWVCDSEANATSAANFTGGPAPAGCQSVGGGVRTSHATDVDDPLGNPGNDEPGTFIDVTANTSGFIYYVGRIRTQSGCFDQVNDVNIQWGCETDSVPPGGIPLPATTGGLLPPTYSTSSQADLSVQVATAALNVTQAVTGINPSQPVGSSGLVTIQIDNQTGSTVRNIDLTNTLPAEYVVDYTFTPTAVVTPAYGTNYAGMIDTITWDNQDPNPLNNTAPHFTLTSSTTRAVSTVPGDDEHLLRHGDVLTIQFRIVLIDAPRYDLVADLDVTPEIQGDSTDPDSDFTVTNSIHINFDNICGQTGLTVPDSVQNFPADIEDLDVAISDALFILTNDPGTPLPLNVILTNNGGHDADNYVVYISFGPAMSVSLVPAGCAITSNPPPHPHWEIPAPIPSGAPADAAAVYACNRGVIAPGASNTITFEVIKSAAPAANDDLTFRADLVGEVTLFDGTPLTFPAPASIVNTTPDLQLANNYSLDAVRSRVLGFNLNKSVYYCTEGGGAEPAPSVPPPATPADLNVQIGEDCNYHIESGGWFGFLTPGFTLIAVENVVVTDDMPDGQGMIHFNGTDPFIFNNTANIVLNGVNGGAGTTPLDETDISWSFNTTGSGITIKDEFFRVDFKTRQLNDPVDLAYPVPGGYAPNLHANLSTDIARTSFDAIFNSISGNLTINVNDAAGIPGYPVPAIRTVDLTQTEPNIIVTKEVCNESRNGVGPLCNRFVSQINSTDTLDAGDSDDMYIYRITLTNEASSGGVPRSPAFNVSVTDVLDASDLMGIDPVTDPVAPFENDGLDNDGDGFIDSPAFGGNDLDGEFQSLTENVPNGGTPATFVISHQHSDALDRIDPGVANQVVFYYRIDPDDAVAPLEILDNTLTTTYDSLEGDFGNQNAPQLDNTAPNNSGRARIYTAIDESTSIQMLPLQTQPKAIVQTSNTTLGGSPQEVVVGEEVRFELHTLIPIANLRNFVIRDELPPGLRCMDTPVLQLNSTNSSGTGRNYAAAGFNPGGNITPTCTSTGTNDVVEWNLGNQELTSGTPGSLFDFEIDFTARVENTNQVQDNCNLRNGGSSGAAAVPAPTPCSTDPTLARATYTDESGGTITLNYGAADLVVREPTLVVDKSFAPVTDTDAGDLLDITVTIENTGNADAYNLQIMDNLIGTNMTYQPVPAPGGTDPPDVVDTSVANRPIFIWTAANPDFTIEPGPANAKSFTFRVRVDDIVEPFEVLDNTINARWTSLPSVNTALPTIGSGAPRTLAADGTDEGMRNGQLPGLASPSLNPPNDYNAQDTAQVVVPAATIAKAEVGPVPLPEIGAVKHFQIVLDFPEGVTSGVTVTDNLNAGGVSYFFEHNADYDITYTFNGIETINGQPPSELTFGADPTLDDGGYPTNNQSGTVIWVIGDVDTVAKDDQSSAPIDREIIIDYYVRINNDTDTDIGDGLQNTATLTYDTQTTPVTASTPSVTVVEPVLTIDKAASNLTQPGLDPDAGDLLRYTVTLSNATGTGQAYDLNIQDTIPAGTLLDTTPANAPTALLDGSAIGAFTSTPTNSPSGPLIWGRGNGDLSLDIPPGSELVLTYHLIVQDTVEALQPLNNSVVVDWTSLQDSAVTVLARERDGGTCPVIAAPDDYCLTDTFNLQVSNNNNISKTYNSDTFAPTNDRQLRIGDRVEYTLTVTLQEGTTTAMFIRDALPAGMDFIGVNTINGVAAAGLPLAYSDATTNFTYLGGDIPATNISVSTAGGIDTVTFDLGDVRASGDNLSATDDFVIVYTAQVVDDELPMPQNPSTPLTNIAELEYEDFNNAVVPARVDSESITALQPRIQLADIAKTRRGGGLSGEGVIATSSASGGDIMDFQLDVCNTGLAPAYDIVVEDILAPQMNETTIRAPGAALGSGTDPQVRIAGTLLTDGTHYTYTPPVGAGGTMRFTFDDAATPLPAGECIVIQYDIDNNSIGIDQSWDNSLQVTTYSSLDGTAPDADVNSAQREIYNTLVGPVTFTMQTFAPILTIDKTTQTPLSREATIGELVTYQIVFPDRDPGTGLPDTYNATLFDIRITDTHSPALEFVDAVLDPSSTYAVPINVPTDVTILASNQFEIFLDELPAGQRAVINITARVANNASAQNSLAAFGNGVGYVFAATDGGSTVLGMSDTTPAVDDISIIEPELTLQSKAVANLTKPGNAPDAGDILQYTLTIDAAGGALYSDAFDVSIVDSMSLGLVYSGNSAISAGVGTISDPAQAGDGVSTPQVLTWDLANGSNIDIPEGTTSVTITYEVRVLDSVLANQTLSNSAVVRWSSLNGVDANERDGSGGVNDYISGPETSSIDTPNNNAITKTHVTDTSPVFTVDEDVRIGDIVDFRLTMSLQEGTSNNVVLTDQLPQGIQFEGVVSADVAPVSVSTTGNPATGPTDVVFTFGNITNPGFTGVNDGNNDFNLVYRARVLNGVQGSLNNPPNNITFTNTVEFDYDTAAGPINPALSDNETINLRQPNLSVAKNVATQFGDLILDAGEQVNYTVDIVNAATANSNAHDVRLEDTIPLGLREGGVTIVSTTLGGLPVANPPPASISYNSTTGLLVIDFDTGVANAYSIQPNQTLSIEYQVLADAGIGAGLSNIINSAVVPVYHSFDDEDPTSTVAPAVTGVREIYGPTNTATAPALSTPAPRPLEKANPASLNQSIGIPFSYTITVPDAPQATALYDVKIIDDLASLSPNVDLSFVSVQKIAGSGSWVPVNNGTSTNVVIEDLADGIDIPAGEQIQITLTVVLRNTPNNSDGDTFINQASYTYNAINGDVASQQNGGSDSDVALRIVEPLSMTLTKTGPATMQFGTPSSFTVDVENTGNGPAYDITITDRLPNPTDGGICDTSPVVTSARVFESNGTTPASIALVENTHFVTSYTAAPTCEFTITTTDAVAVVQPGQRLIVNFDATLDQDNFNGSQLINYAAVTQWFSGDTPAGVIDGEIREYNRAFSTTDLGTEFVVDHEDLHRFDIVAPELSIIKRVNNYLTGQPAVTAEPGEKVQYIIDITNSSPIAAANNFSLTDEPDALNGVGYFVPGSMEFISVTQGDTSATNINAGNNGAGILDVQNLTLSNSVIGNNTLSISFVMTLQNVLDNGTIVANQADVNLAGFSTLRSDSNDASLINPEDPTVFTIGSTPTFNMTKESADITGDTSVLRAGDTLRYTIRLQNVGAENSINTLLRDQIPANTTYVANSTMLNGTIIPDPSAGVSPLQDGLLVNAPENATQGFMRAEAGGTTNIAEVQFEVVVNQNVVNGTVISNQSYVGGEGVGSGAFAEQPSDDPATDIKGDPTRDVVGNVAVIDAQKTVEVIVDAGTADEVDTGDILRYTIIVSNYGSLAASGVILTDLPPNDTVYIADSLKLNGTVVTGTVLPLSTGLSINSAGAPAGTIDAMQSAEITFDVAVTSSVNGTVISNQALVESNEFPNEQTDVDGNDLNGDQPTEIIIGSTQQLSISKEVFVVGGGTAQPGGLLEYFIHIENIGSTDVDLAGTDVLSIYDDITISGLASYVDDSVRVNGAAFDDSTASSEVIYANPRLTINYGDIFSGPFEPNDRLTIRYLLRIDPNAAQGASIANTAAIDWGTQDFVPTSNTAPAYACGGVSPNVDACASISIQVGGAPGVANLSGRMWHDANHSAKPVTNPVDLLASWNNAVNDETADPNEFKLADWEVQIFFGSGTTSTAEYLDSVYTDAEGRYNVLGLIPVEGDVKKYALRFRPPGSDANTAGLGTIQINPALGAVNPEGQSVLLNLDVAANSHTNNILLPIQPNGVVYDSVLRTPVADAELVMVRNSGPLDSSCFLDPVQQNQVTTSAGYYKFDLDMSNAACQLDPSPAANDAYRIEVYQPAGYFDADEDPNVDTPAVSAIIPPALPLTAAGYDVPLCDGDANTATGECEVQASQFAPPTDFAPRTSQTDYYLRFKFATDDDEEQIYNNHIPLDPELDDAIAISKVSAMVNVTRSQLVPYTITVTNTLPAPLYDLNILDIFPPGFKYINGSARIQRADGTQLTIDPVYVQGTEGIPTSTLNQEIATAQVNAIQSLQEFNDIARLLAWNDLGVIGANETMTLKLLLVVGSGVGEGEYVNRVVATNNATGGASSRIAQATVRVVPDPTFDCSDVIGKVYDDKNLNAYQDEGEPGIAGARVITPKGLEVTTDAHGRFSIACAVVPNPDRGSNFIIKLDERSLPTGYRITTENPRVVRATRGKMTRFNFGAAIHRVVRLDMADPVFEPGTTEMRPQWLPRLDLLMTELARDPSILRLSYLAENETPSEVNARLDAVKSEIEQRWEALNCCYQLTIETDVFWRKGGPPDRGAFDD